MPSTKYKWKTKGLGTPETAYPTGASLTSSYHTDLATHKYFGNDDSNSSYAKYGTSGGLFSYGWGNVPLAEYKSNKSPIFAKYAKNIPIPWRDISDPQYWEDYKGSSFCATDSGSSVKAGMSVYVDANNVLQIVGMNNAVSQPDCYVCMIEVQAKGGDGGSSSPSGGGGGGAYAFMIVNLNDLSTKRLSIQNSSDGVYIYFNTSSNSGTSSDYILVGAGQDGSGATGFSGSGGGNGGTVSSSGNLSGVNLLLDVSGGKGGSAGDTNFIPANGGSGQGVESAFYTDPANYNLVNTSITVNSTYLGKGGSGGAGGEYSSGGGSDWEDGGGTGDGWEDGWDDNVGDFASVGTFSTRATTTQYYGGGGGGGASMLGSGINGADSSYASFGSTVDSRSSIGYGGGGGGKSNDRAPTTTGGPYLIKVYI